MAELSETPSMTSSANSKTGSRHERTVTLKTIAEHLGVTAGTVSATLNNSAAARCISAPTKQRIIAAARELDYKPNFFAQTLRGRRTQIIGVITERIEDFYGSSIISGIEQYLQQKNYFSLIVVHRRDPQLLQTYFQLLEARGVEGFIAIDTSIEQQPPLSTVFVGGRLRVGGVTNVTLDHKGAARLALKHLKDLGHKEIAFMQVHPQSPNSAARWSATRQAAAHLGIEIRPELIGQVESADLTQAGGYLVAKQLLERKLPFTALFAYNDISAIGSIRAFREAGLCVPQDISVVGFDDIPGAGFTNPGLSTVRQPLVKMGRIAAQTLVDRIECRGKRVRDITVEPEFVVRQSTGPVSS
jgi:DNA-binding LacI/PurR family transcriptional regulator